MNDHKKYAPRTSPVINKQQSSSYAEDQWLSHLAKSLIKESVKSKKEDSSLFDQINSIMNNKHSKYSSVDEAVKEMQERSGLSAYLNKLRASEEVNKKVATDSNNSNKKIEIFKKNPSIFYTIDNYVKSTKGNLPVSAVLEHVKSIHKNDLNHPVSPEDWDNSDLIKFTNDLIQSYRKQNNSTNPIEENLGKIDTSNSDIGNDLDNTDYFAGLIPKK